MYNDYTSDEEFQPRKVIIGNSESIDIYNKISTNYIGRIKTYRPIAVLFFIFSLFVTVVLTTAKVFLVLFGQNEPVLVWIALIFGFITYLIFVTTKKFPCYIHLYAEAIVIIKDDIASDVYQPTTSTYTFGSLLTPFIKIYFVNLKFNRHQFGETYITFNKTAMNLIQTAFGTTTSQEL